MPDLSPERIDIDLISVPSRHREVDQDAVKRIAESIERIGLHTPLTVLSVNEGERLDLVTGAHRLEAVRSLGWPSVPCFVIEGDQLEAEMWEISENLHRSELTALQRDEHIARWLELASAQIVASCDSSKPGPKGTGREAAKKIGVDKDAAYRAEKVASLSDEAKEAARSVGLDNNRSALLEAAKELTPEAQVSAIQRRYQAKIADHPLNDDEAIERQVAYLMTAWNKAGSDARERFLELIGER